MIISFLLLFYQHCVLILCSYDTHQIRLSKDWKEMVGVVKGSHPYILKGRNGYQKVYHLVAKKLLVNEMQLLTISIETRKE